MEGNKEKRASYIHHENMRKATARMYGLGSLQTMVLARFLTHDQMLALIKQYRQHLAQPKSGFASCNHKDVYDAHMSGMSISDICQMFSLPKGKVFESISLGALQANQNKNSGGSGGMSGGPHENL